MIFSWAFAFFPAADLIYYTTMDEIAIVDYRAGNLTSVRLAFEALGLKPIVTSDAGVIRQASRVVFPGVGAAKSAMDSIASLDLAEVLRESAQMKPFLGICLGMQILFEHSEEDGGVDMLGILPGKVQRFPSIPGVKIPQIGWNDSCGEYYYFVHSYYADICPYTTGIAEYAGVKFTSMVKKGRLWATQFHPEKSGKAGMKLLEEWLSC